MGGAHAAKAAFTWWPKAELYPLVGTVLLACGFCTYSSYRNFSSNPDVGLTKAHRGDIEHAARGVRAEEYMHAFYRKASQRRTRDQDGVADVRIMRI